MKLQITQKHINLGQKSSGFNCPIALALEEATQTSWFVASKATAVYYNNLQIPLTEEAVIFIHRFDGCYHVEPFEMEIEDETFNFIFDYLVGLTKQRLPRTRLRSEGNAETETESDRRPVLATA